MNVIHLISAITFLPFFINFGVSESVIAQHQQAEASKNAVPCPHLPASVSDEDKKRLRAYCEGNSNYPPVVLEEAIHWFSSQESIFYISACVVGEAKYIDEGVIAILIAMNGTERTYLKRPDWDYNILLAWVWWEDEDVLPGTFEIWNGGVWSQEFAGNIYDHLIELPFVRRTETSMEDIAEIASARICEIDHSPLDEIWNPDE